MCACKSTRIEIPASLEKDRQREKEREKEGKREEEKAKVEEREKIRKRQITVKAAPDFSINKYTNRSATKL